MFSEKDIRKFSTIETPFYYYNLELLRKTLACLERAVQKKYHVHYALKANAHPILLEEIRKAGLGADCVSGNEVKRAVECGFPSDKIVFAGVGKNDREINFALDHNIYCFNTESVHELQILNQLAANKNKKANIALRVNPNVDAHTHKYITTGLEENKFGINPYEFPEVLDALDRLDHLKLTGIHFHIGSQIQDLNAFKNLSLRVNEINNWFTQHGREPQHVNLGGGLGVDYMQPDEHAIPDFENYFALFRQFLEVNPKDGIHFELGRSVTAQCGSLISRVLFIKNGINTNFAILDAGMTELMRPALYQAYHKIQNISRAKTTSLKKYDVVGPICESSDCFGKAVELPETERGDLIAIRTAGAYGEVMSNHYNLRDQVNSVFSE